MANSESLDGGVPVDSVQPAAAASTGAAVNDGVAELVDKMSTSSISDTDRDKRGRSEAGSGNPHDQQRGKWATQSNATDEVTDPDRMKEVEEAGDETQAERMARRQGLRMNPRPRQKDRKIITDDERQAHAQFMKVALRAEREILAAPGAPRQENIDMQAHIEHLVKNCPNPVTGDNSGVVRADEEGRCWRTNESRICWRTINDTINDLIDRIEREAKQVSDNESETASDGQVQTLETPVSTRTRSQSGLEPTKTGDVTRLLERLRDNDKGLSSLKLKESIEFETRELHEILITLTTNTSVRVVYLQNQPAIDETIPILIEVLKKGNIWAVNLGEWNAVTCDAWGQLLDAIPDTNVCFMYITEPKLCGLSADQKKQFRATIRANREKKFTDWYTDSEQRELALHVEKMWWDPTNSKHLKSYVEDTSP
eukprot:SAG22_NODE_2895_length_2119_cov_1.504455_2_plen_426_part_01